MADQPTPQRRRIIEVADLNREARPAHRKSANRGKLRRWQRQERKRRRQELEAAAGQQPAAAPHPGRQRAEERKPGKWLSRTRDAERQLQRAQWERAEGIDS